MGTSRSTVRRLPVTTRRVLLLAGMTISLLLALAAGARALSPAVNTGDLQFGGPPAVAVESSGTAQIAWANENGTHYTIDTCTLPVGATACSQTHVLTPAGGGEPRIDAVKLLVDGSTIVLLADVYGVGSEEY